MKLVEYLKELRKRGERTFTVSDLVKRFQISHDYARVALHRLLRSGDIISPARGFYVIIPPEYQIQGSIPAKELMPLMMRHLGVSYYVALLSAGLFYGATHQKSAKFQVISDKRIKRKLVFGDIAIEFIYKKNLLGLPTQNFTVSTGYLAVAAPELIALDLLNYPEHSGGLNHIATVFSELIESLNADKLISLAEQIKSEYQLQRIGYILDHIDFIDDTGAKEIIDRIADYIQKNKSKYLPLASELPQKNFPKCEKWRIVINTEIESDL